MTEPVLFIPGPVELSPEVRRAAAEPPLAHTSPQFIQLFGDTLRAMRTVWRASPEHQPFVLAGSGTLAMEVAACNLLDPGQTALVVQTGVFGDRMARILGRRGVHVVRVAADAGRVPSMDRIGELLDEEPVQAVFATHVDTSTGVRLDVRALAALTRARGVLSVLDSVCAVGGEVCEQAAWDIDVVLSASQKALGAAPGLALLVVSPRALDARRDLRVPPPLFLDLEEWLPVHHALEGGVPSYFATPPTSLVRALATALGELDVTASIERHARVAANLRTAWRHLGLALVPDESDAANTLSALWIPNGVETQLPRRVADHGVLVAGALHPALRPRSFRVGHMGWVTRRPELLEQCVRAIGAVLVEAGRSVDVEGAVASLGRSEGEVDGDRVATGRH